MIELSVVIPTFNGATRLRGCLDALASQSAPPESYEVIIVDDGSTDGTAALLEGAEEPFRLRSSKQSNLGPSAARNRGIAIAEGTYCLFMDDDIRAGPRLVEQHLHAQRTGDGVVCLGALRLRPRGRGGLARHFASWWEQHYRRLEEGERQPDLWDCFTGNMSAPTAALRDTGGFDEKLRRSEDVELGYRLQKAGLPIVYAAKAAAEQHHSKGFREIVRDFDRAGAAAPTLWRRHPELLDHRPLGDFSQSGSLALLARRLLLAVRAPVWPLALVDPLLGRRARPRLYTLLQRHCFWRSFRRALGDDELWRRFTRGPVILMYHAVGAAGERASRYVVPVRRLRLQLAWLRLRRRPVLTLDQYVEHRREHRLPPPRSVVITFDDGYAEVGTAAAPMLARMGLPATVFVVAGAVGGVNEWDRAGPMAGRPLMSWDTLRSVQAQGIAIGAHTVTHPHLTELGGAPAAREVDGSRSRLEGELGTPVRHFAYPYGERSEETEELVRDAGFASACEASPGINDPVVGVRRLRRLEVRGDRPLTRFVLDLWLGRHVGDPAG